MKRTMKQCYYTSVEATSRDEGFSPESMKQIHQTTKEGYSEKNYTFLEIVKMRQNYRDIKANLSFQITPIDVEDKSNKNQCE